MPLVCRDAVLFRTGAHPSIRFSQISVIVYMGDPPAAPQTAWLDELVVAAAPP